METTIIEEYPGHLLVVSSNQEAEPEDVPTYTADGEIQSELEVLAAVARSDGGEMPITNASKNVRYHLERDAVGARFRISDAFFEAIKAKQSEVAAMLIQQGLVTPNTINIHGTTPLLLAVAAGDVRMVQELVDFGAQIDDYGDVISNISGKLFGGMTYLRRTPLQLAASKGNLTMVKLLIETYHADDSLIAPDGETALHLARKNGHRDVLDYLPSRRGGEWQRWKTHNRKAIKRATKAVKGIYWFFRIIIWEIPKFFLWTIPKHVAVLPLKEDIVWAYKHRHGFLPWCKRRILGIPRGIHKLGKKLWKTAKLIPSAMKKVAKSTWTFFTDYVPKRLRFIWKWLVSFFTVRIPQAAKIIAGWVANGFKTVVTQIYTIFERGLSLLHTAFMGLVSFLRTATLQDIWNGIIDLFHAIFVTLPVEAWNWMKKFGDVSYHALASLFGLFGKAAWYLVVAVFLVVQYVPSKIGIVLSSLGGSLVKGWQEFLIWLNPKR